MDRKPKFTGCVETLEAKYPGLNIDVNRDFAQKVMYIRVTYETKKPECFIDDLHQYPIEMSINEIDSFFCNLESKILSVIAERK